MVTHSTKNLGGERPTENFPALFFKYLEKRQSPEGKPMSIVKGKIKPALTTWPMGLVHPEKWPLEKLCRAAKQLGVGALEFVNPEEFPTLKSHGLISTLTTSHMFIKGPNNR